MDDAEFHEQHEGRFDRFATRVGDLDHPFYEEERERDVWNESTAVGLQVVLWGTPAVGAACLWFAGAAAVPYVTVMLVPLVLAMAVTLAYARRQGVDPAARSDQRRTAGRAALFALLAAALAAGYVRAGVEIDAPSPVVESFLRGAAQGAAAMVLLLAVALVTAWLFARARSRRPR